MNRRYLPLALSLIILSCQKDVPPKVVMCSPVAPIAVPTDAKPVTKTNPQKVFVAYQPWFETKATSSDGKWGQHWSMATQNPDLIGPDGKRQIASYFYPMIGPYASSDPDVIDYHLLLMKYAGIDGVVADWYGSSNVYDYPLNRRNTDSLFNRTPKAGLLFSVCYEDATLKNVLSIAGVDNVTQATQDVQYLQSHYFPYTHYATINSQPMVLCFGPQQMLNPSDWKKAFASQDLCIGVKFISLEYHGDAAGSEGDGEFAWVGPGNLVSLQDFYQTRATGLPAFIAGAYPGFKDYYSPGGWGNTLFVIDHDTTNTLQSTLDLAKTSGTGYVQLITWNDFGEGTMIEPTDNFQFSFLETIQKYTGVAYTKTELQLIYGWYTRRKKYAGNTTVQQKLDQAYTALVSLDVAAATTIISNIP